MVTTFKYQHHLLGRLRVNPIHGLLMGTYKLHGLGCQWYWEQRSTHPGPGGLGSSYSTNMELGPKAIPFIGFSAHNSIMAQYLDPLVHLRTS